MIKKQLYGSTKRISNESVKIQITEKLDGSNLGIYKKNNIIYFAQRNNIFSEYEIELMTYKGLKGWAVEHLEFLRNDLHDGAIIFGEWLGDGFIKYDDIQNRFAIFAKGRINENIVEKYNYNLSLLHYAFVNEKIPNYLSVVNLIETDKFEVNDPVGSLDVIYQQYVKEVNRKVEGFVLTQNNNAIGKYVRFKDGKPSEHKC